MGKLSGASFLGCYSTKAAFPADSRRIQEDNASAASTREEDISSGKAFLKCFLKDKGKEENDLMDFVEIKEGKDYFSWSKNRDKYRTKKLDKMTDMRRKRQRKAWAMINEERTQTLNSASKR